MLKIYGNSFSMPCNKVRYICELEKLDYEWVHMEFGAGDMKKPEFLAVHPAGKVPAMDDDGFILFESDAICRYLCTKAESSLYPTELHARAVMDQWTAFGNFHIGLAMGKVGFNRVVAPKFGLPIDENSMNEGEAWLARYLPIVETRLGQVKYLAGENLSLADITLLSILDMSKPAGVDLTGYEKLFQWLKELRGREFWTNCRE